ncbi:unnamed protein product, partial [Schistosoma margrebowiei]
VGPAAYVLFDELYTKENVFRSLITSNKTLNIRLLGRYVKLLNESLISHFATFLQILYLFHIWHTDFLHSKLIAIWLNYCPHFKVVLFLALSSM